MCHHFIKLIMAYHNVLHIDLCYFSEFLCMLMTPFVSNETKGKLDIRKELYPDFIKLSEWLKAN